MNSSARSIVSATLLLIVLFLSAAAVAEAQVENVPAGNQVYGFLDRLGVKGILPLHSGTIIPLSRREVADLLVTARARRDELSGAERDYLEKFLAEFAREADPASEEAAGLLNGSPASDFLSRRENYLYRYADSAATLYLEFLGSLEHRRADGDSFGATNASFETHGFRARGTLHDRLGYFLQVTNGTLRGDRAFAISDRRLRTNVKFNDLNSPYFDFTEAYLRADLSWFNLEFGREFTKVGTGYSDRLLFSDNAPAPDIVRLDARYGAVRYLFLHGSVLPETALLAKLEGGPGGPAAREVNKYFVLHRLECSLFGLINAAFSELAVYYRSAPEFAYLNPLIFLKSAEHSLRDRDNTMLALDLELLPAAGYKLYGALLVDDVDFSKLGTGWWGNQFGWQGGAYLAGVAGINDLDATVEYTRLEPYLYSNRTPGNAWTNGDFGMGHRLEPNSDEWFMELSVRPSASLRGSLGARRVRHGGNIVLPGGEIVNVGGDVLTGHRPGDAETAHFLDGLRTTTNSVEARVYYEPFTDLVFSGMYGYRLRAVDSAGDEARDHFFGVRAEVEL